MRTGAAWQDRAPGWPPGLTALIALEAFTGLTALGGGALLMARPNGSLLAIAPSALAALEHDSPFPDFSIPGLVLAVVVGGGMLDSAVVLARRCPPGLALAVAGGAALAIFELVAYAASGFMPLQAFEGVVGLLVLALAASLRSAGVRPGRRVPV